MLIHDNAALVERIQVEVFDVPRCILYFQVEHLVEIAVVEIAVPTYRQGVAAHDMGSGYRIISIDQRLHIALVVAAADEVFQKAADGQVDNSFCSCCGIFCQSSELKNILSGKIGTLVSRRQVHP